MLSNFDDVKRRTSIWSCNGVLELQIQEITYRINSRADRMFELVTDNNWESSVYFDLVIRNMVKEKEELFARIDWREKRILELESENEFDTLALDNLCRQWIGAWGRRSPHSQRIVTPSKL